MQPTKVQVERSLEALRSPGRGGPATSRETHPDVPPAVVEWVLRAPEVRAEALAVARRRLAAGQVPTDDALAESMVGRLVCDRLR